MTEMDGFDKIEKISDNEFEKMTEEQQSAYNRQIRAEKEYEKTMNLNGPLNGFVVGLGIGVIGFLVFFNDTIGTIAGFLCIIAFLWALMLVMDRAHRYQRLKDASNEFKRIFEVKN